MTYLPQVAAATEAEWPDLAVELDRWEEAGRIARLWWRDDDAVASTPRLDRLLQIAGGGAVYLAGLGVVLLNGFSGPVSWQEFARVLELK